MAMSKVEIDLLFQIICLYAALVAFVVPSLLWIISYLSRSKSDQETVPGTTEPIRGRLTRSRKEQHEQDSNDDG